VDMKIEPTDISVEAGGSVDCAVDVIRKHGFVGPISLEMQSPTPLAGLAIQPTTVAPEVAQGVLSIATSPATPPGKHRLALKGKVSFFDREVTFERKVSLIVSPKPPEAPTP
jgi:hypothetical protein